MFKMDEQMASKLPKMLSWNHLYFN